MRRFFITVTCTLLAVAVLASVFTLMVRRPESTGTKYEAAVQPTDLHATVEAAVARTLSKPTPSPAAPPAERVVAPGSIERSLAIPQTPIPLLRPRRLHSTQDSIFVDWTPPEVQGITFYQVDTFRLSLQQDGHWMLIRSENIPGPDTEHLIEGLEAETQYAVAIAAYVREGSPVAATTVLVETSALSPEQGKEDSAAHADANRFRIGATVMDADAAMQDIQWLHGYSLDRTNGDAVDYYKFTLYERYELGLGIRDQSIKLYAQVEDKSGEIIAQSWPPSWDPGSEWILATLEAGTYYVRVQAAEDGYTDYIIRFRLTPPRTIG